MASKPRSVVLYGAGHHSLATVLWAKDVDRTNPVLFFVDYGHKAARREWEETQKVASKLRVEAVRHEFDLHDFAPGCTILSRFVGSTHGALARLEGRNVFLISLGAMYATAIRARFLYYGAHRYAKRSHYPDSEPRNVRRMQSIIDHLFVRRVKLRMPFSRWTHDWIVQYVVTFAPDLMRHVMSCYVPRVDGLPCGKCGHCRRDRTLVIPASAEYRPLWAISPKVTQR